MFFDCTVDPYQTTNLYPDLSNETKADLAQLVLSTRDCSGVLCP